MRAAAPGAGDAGQGEWMTGQDPERDLAALAAALAGRGAALTGAERAIVPGRRAPLPRRVESARPAVARGDDPLGAGRETFVRRRLRGGGEGEQARCGKRATERRFMVRLPRCGFAAERPTRGRLPPGSASCGARCEEGKGVKIGVGRIRRTANGVSGEQRKFSGVSCAREDAV